MSKPIDISTWDAAKRSIIYQLSEQERCFGTLMGMSIASDGRARLMIYRDHGVQPWAPGSKPYGYGVGHWRFVNEITEYVNRLEIASGIKKPGAPLPPVVADFLKSNPAPVAPPEEKGDDNGGVIFGTGDDSETEPKSVNLVDEQSTGSSKQRRTAVKASRL